MNIYSIFQEMKRRHLVESMRGLSQHWLGRAQNFAATHQSEPLPPETAIRLRRHLMAAGHPDLAAMVLLSILGELDDPRRYARRSS